MIWSSIQTCSWRPGSAIRGSNQQAARDTTHSSCAHWCVQAAHAPDSGTPTIGFALIIRLLHLRIPHTQSSRANEQHGQRTIILGVAEYVASLVLSARQFCYRCKRCERALSDHCRWLMGWWRHCSDLRAGLHQRLPRVHTAQPNTFSQPHCNWAPPASRAALQQQS